MPNDLDAEVWEALGEEDPDWAVSSDPGRIHGGWSGSLDDFYLEGEERVSEALGLVPDLEFGRALDWGSGTGRLSFALSARFSRVTCVDISTAMQALLKDRASERGISNLDIVTTDEFTPEGNHDLALSLITLQHFPDRDSVEDALRKMVSALRPGGSLLVEIPLRAHTLRYRLQPRRQAYRLLRRAGMSHSFLHARGLSGIRMLCIPQDWVVGVLTSAGAGVVDVIQRRGTSHQQAYYVATRVGTAKELRSI